MRILWLAALLAGCSVFSVETPDPAAIPTGSIEAEGVEATGPIIELGSGQALDTGWRYAIYPSDDGWCTQIETALVTSAGCGDPFPAEGEILGGVTSGAQLGNGVTAVEGMTVDEIATVWIVLEDGRRAPAQLMPLDEAGLEGQAFFLILSTDDVVTHVQAVALSGEILDTFEFP